MNQSNEANSYSDASEHKHEHDSNGHHPNGACNTHLARAFDQYSAYLETARCICRSILESGPGNTCCGAQPKKAPLSFKEEPSQGRSTAHKDNAAHHHHGVKRRGRKSRSADEHDHEWEIMPMKEGSDCCSGQSHGEHAHHGHGGSEKLVGAIPVEVDVEKGVVLETVSLSVEGMTCSGCGNKLERTLKNMRGVSGVRVNFVMGNAEFSVDPNIVKGDEYIRNAERATGLLCTKLSSDDQTLDILASGNSAKALVYLEISGVNQTSIIDKKIVRLAYDPTIIGARNLMEKVGQLGSGLAPPRDVPSVARGRRRMLDQLVKTIASAALTVPVLLFGWGNVVDKKSGQIASLVLATLVQLIAVPDFYRPALSALIFSRTVEMDMLVVISITAAYAYSVVAFSFMMIGKPLDTGGFFETSTLLITLVLLGRLVAAFARVRAVQAVSLRSLQPATAIVIENGEEREIDARLLQYGDKFKVLPHTTIPTDGLVLSGTSEVDESMLTGESAPVLKQQGDAVIAGTINGSGSMAAKLTRLLGKNTVSDIAELVEEAANSKPKIQDLADRVASWFVPVVTSIAIVVTVSWLAVGFKIRNYETGKAIANAITYAVATLAISCPCALGLAVPMVLVVAGGIAARNGVIIKSGECTERARKVTDVVFDKTGTITDSELDVVEETFFGDNKEQAIAITKALVGENKHPVSVAVTKHLEQLKSPEIKLTNQHVIPGAGVQAVLNDIEIRAGNPRWAATQFIPSLESLENDGLTVLVVTRASQPLAIFGLRTRLRPEAIHVVSKLKGREIDCHIVSGDQIHAVETVSALVGISNLAAQRSPSQKRDYVASLMAQGKTVMFVGDGTNDAVAVTQADVGVQLGSASSASDVTRGAAGVVLLNGLEGILFLLEISDLSFHRMLFNFIWSGVYNFVAIFFASGALVRVRIPPAYAGLGEIVSVLPVIIAAATMLVTKIKPQG